MTEAQFAEYVQIYCTAVGAGVGVREHLAANYRTLVGAWKVTALDLSEIAFRLVSGKRIPNWPKEHSEAIGRELDAIRAEKMAAMMPVRTSHECPVCDGTGLVIVPHPCCVHRGRVAGYYDRFARIRRPDVVTVTVICTAPKCWRGESTRLSLNRHAEETKRAPMMTLDKYLAKMDPGFEPTMALREWERERAEASRVAESAAATSPKERDELERSRGVYRRIIANIFSRRDEWSSREGYRDPAEVDDDELIPM